MLSTTFSCFVIASALLFLHCDANQKKNDVDDRLRRIWFINDNDLQWNRGGVNFFKLGQRIGNFRNNESEDNAIPTNRIKSTWFANDHDLDVFDQVQKDDAVPSNRIRSTWFKNNDDEDAENRHLLRGNEKISNNYATQMKLPYSRKIIRVHVKELYKNESKRIPVFNSEIQHLGPENYKNPQTLFKNTSHILLLRRTNENKNLTKSAKLFDSRIKPYSLQSAGLEPSMGNESEFKKDYSNNTLAKSLTNETQWPEKGSIYWFLNNNTLEGRVNRRKKHHSNKAKWKLLARKLSTLLQPLVSNRIEPFLGIKKANDVRILKKVEPLDRIRAYWFLRNNNSRPPTSRYLKLYDSQLADRKQFRLNKTKKEHLSRIPATWFQPSTRIEQISANEDKNRMQATSGQPTENEISNRSLQVTAKNHVHSHAKRFRSYLFKKESNYENPLIRSVSFKHQLTDEIPKFQNNRKKNDLDIIRRTWLQRARNGIYERVLKHPSKKRKHSHMNKNRHYWFSKNNFGKRSHARRIGDNWFLKKKFKQVINRSPSFNYISIDNQDDNNEISKRILQDPSKNNTYFALKRLKGYWFLINSTEAPISRFPNLESVNNEMSQKNLQFSIENKTYSPSNRLKHYLLIKNSTEAPMTRSLNLESVNNEMNKTGLQVPFENNTYSSLKKRKDNSLLTNKIIQKYTSKNNTDRPVKRKIYWLLHNDTETPISRFLNLIGNTTNSLKKTKNSSETPVSRFLSAQESNLKNKDVRRRVSDRFLAVRRRLPKIETKSFSNVSKEQRFETKNSKNKHLRKSRRLSRSKGKVLPNAFGEQLVKNRNRKNKSEDRMHSAWFRSGFGNKSNRSNRFNIRKAEVSRNAFGEPLLENRNSKNQSAMGRRGFQKSNDKSNPNSSRAPVVRNSKNKKGNFDSRLQKIWFATNNKGHASRKIVVHPNLRTFFSMEDGKYDTSNKRDTSSRSIFTDLFGAAPKRKLPLVRDTVTNNKTNVVKGYNNSRRSGESDSRKKAAIARLKKEWFFRDNDTAPIVRLIPNDNTGSNNKDNILNNFPKIIVTYEPSNLDVANGKINSKDLKLVLTEKNHSPERASKEEESQVSYGKDDPHSKRKAQKSEDEGLVESNKSQEVTTTKITPEYQVNNPHGLERGSNENIAADETYVVDENDPVLNMLYEQLLKTGDKENMTQIANTLEEYFKGRKENVLGF